MKARVGLALALGLIFSGGYSLAGGSFNVPGASGNIVDDTTPQLGGDLDVNGNKITSSDDITLKLGDNAGVNKVIIEDSDSTEVVAIDSDGTITAVDIHIAITATGDDQHAVNITVDGAGFGDIKSFDVDYTTGDMQSGDDSAVMLLNIDESGASGGEVFGIEVLATEGNTTVTGLNVGQGVGPLRQSSGTTGDMDSFLIIAVDKLTEALSAATADLPYFLADNDTITIGDAAVFDAMTFVISTGASANGIVPVFEFWNGGAWVAFTPVDGTDGWRSTGSHIIKWDLTDISTWAVDGNTEYVIRVTRTKGTLTTEPVGSQVQIASSTVFSWDKDGDLNIRQLTLSGTANLQDNTLQRANLLDTGIVTQALSGTGNKTIDLTSGNSVTHTAFGAITWTFSNPTATNSMSTIFLSLITGGTGAQTWPTNVIWESGSAPTLLDTQQDFTTDFGVDDKLDITGHGFQNGERVHTTTSGVHPAGLNADIIYFVINKTTDDFELSLTLGGSAIDIADDGTGTHTVHSGENKLVFITDNGGVYWVGIAPVSTGITMASGTQILLDNGTSAAPSMSFLNDPNTGWFTSFSDEISLATGGNTRWTIGGGFLRASNSAGVSILNATASATLPTLVPRTSSINTGIGSSANNVLQLIAGGVEGVQVTTTETKITGGDTNGAFLNIGSATASAAFDADGATHTFSNLIPAGCFLLGVGTRITETIVGATTVEIGDGSDPNLWGASADVLINTTTDYTDYTAAGAVGTLYIAAQSVVVTAVGGAADFSDGTMRIVVHCETNTAPTG